VVGSTTVGNANSKIITLPGTREKYHARCFVCSECKKPFEDGVFVESDDGKKAHEKVRVCVAENITEAIAYAISAVHSARPASMPSWRLCQPRLSSFRASPCPPGPVPNRPRSLPSPSARQPQPPPPLSRSSRHSTAPRHK
jgi:hypothetical protein